MYHRVIRKNDSKIFLQDGMYVDPDTFRRHIEFLKKNFNVIPLQDVLGLNDSKIGGPARKSICVLTFDDGWRDFYKNVFPMLKLYDVSATVFLPTGIVGTKRCFWTDRLAYILNKIYDPGRKWKPLGDSNDYFLKKIENLGRTFEKETEKTIEELKMLSMDEINNILERLMKRWNLDPFEPGQCFLTWEEIREMHHSGVVYFGSHTRNHIILDTIPDEEILKELMESKNNLIEEGVVSTSFVPFSYPNGNHSSKIAELVEKVGYNLALTTEKGWNNIRFEKKDLFLLKRIGIHQDVTSTDKLLAYRIYGSY
jgi:peptidoglycan/xylan/chitin deacetylase (PgdA/CDA1 family)